jgi:hypothetical protein
MPVGVRCDRAGTAARSSRASRIRPEATERSRRLSSSEPVVAGSAVTGVLVWMLALAGLLALTAGATGRWATAAR